METEIPLFTAIEEMRRLSNLEQPFSFAFASYDSTRKKSNGMIIVRKALLAPRETIVTNQYAEHMLSYRDLDEEKVRRCWQPCLMYFNGKKIVI